MWTEVFPLSPAHDFILTRLFLPWSKFWELSDESGWLLVVRTKGEDSIISRVGLLFTWWWGAVVIEHAGLAGQGKADCHFVIQHPPGSLKGMDGEDCHSLSNPALPLSLYLQTLGKTAADKDVVWFHNLLSYRYLAKSLISSRQNLAF